MVNIRSLRNKSIGTTRKIFSKLNSLHLKKYYFETGILFMNIMLRSSILYACETYYNLKENEIRQLERIEENYMRQLLKTKKGCPINQMYWELGQIPARYDIFKIRLFFLKYILSQDENSLILKFFNLQVENPVKGDWASSCFKILKELDISLSLDQIKEMSIYEYKRIVKQKCKESAYNYLIKKRGTKGDEISYPRLEMAEYLLPNNEFSIDEQRKLFELRNRMTDIPSNQCSKEKNKSRCPCGENENMEHVYHCKYLNKKELEVEYEKVYNGNISEQKLVLKRFEVNIEQRRKHLNNEFPNAIPSDPLSSVSVESSNGY